MNYGEAVRLVNGILRSVNMTADQHEQAKQALEVILKGPPVEAKNVNDAIPVSGAIQAS